MGPLDGVKIIELAGLGALPYGTLKLADMGDRKSTRLNSSHP